MGYTTRRRGLINITLATCILTMICTFATSAQEIASRADITGIVIDQYSEQPLLFATVELLGKGGLPYAKTETDLDGLFHFPTVPIGKYIIVIRYVGYQTTEKAIRITRSNHRHIKVRIRESAFHCGFVILPSIAAVPYHTLVRQYANPSFDNATTTITSSAVRNIAR